MKLLVSEDAIKYLDQDIMVLMSYNPEDLIEEIKCLTPHQEVKHLDSVMDDNDLYGLICSCDEEYCYIDIPHRSQSPIYVEFDDIPY